MREIKIDKGVPIGKTFIYPFDKLEPGDSFAVPREERAKLNSNAAYWRVKHPGWEYIIRTSDGQSRIWRLTDGAQK